MSPVASRRVVVGLAALGLFAIALRLAWLGDDAYITLRSVESWVTGHGMRWNPGDRVQTFTHPAWFLLLAAARWCSGEVYFTTIVLSLALATVATVALLWRASAVAALSAVALLLAGARAFGEYSTSGLETPLAFVLLVAFVAAVGRDGEPRERLWRVGFVAALLAATRLDLAVLTAPAVLACCRGLPWRTVVGTGLCAGLPLLAWLAFAAFWFGSPFPVTAHAKAFGVGIPAGEFAVQGLRYLAFAATDDPVLLPTIVLGVALGFATAGARALALGAVLYVAYVVKVGGDFMAGRFLLPPFVVAVAVLGPWLAAHRRRWSVVVAVGAVLLVAVRGLPVWLRSPAHDVPPAALDDVIAAQHGIGDERTIYYPQLGLFAPTRRIPEFGALHALVRPDGSAAAWLLLNGAVGSAGFGAGAAGHVVDPLLCDPLLTRLPARDPQHWRIGHVLRRIPEGYYETLATGTNRLRHPGLRDWYDDLRLATRGPLLAGERIAALWRLATGARAAGFRDFVATDYYHPPRVPFAAGDLPRELPLGTYWFDEPRIVLVYDGGLAVQWPTPQTAATVRLQALGLCTFRLRFLREGVERGAATAVPVPLPADVVGLRAVAGLREEVAAVPAEVGAFDTLWIDAVENAMSHTATGPPGVGTLRLVP